MIDIARAVKEIMDGVFADETGLKDIEIRSLYMDYGIIQQAVVFDRSCDTEFWFGRNMDGSYACHEHD